MLEFPLFTLTVTVLRLVTQYIGLYLVRVPPTSFFENVRSTVALELRNENWLKSRFHFNFAEYHAGSLHPWVP